MKTRLTNKDRIIDSLDNELRTQKLEYVMAFWSVSKETAEKALYSDKTISQ